jgi:hypothetical protein
MIATIALTCQHHFMFSCAAAKSNSHLQVGRGQKMTGKTRDERRVPMYRLQERTAVLALMSNRVFLMALMLSVEELGNAVFYTGQILGVAGLSYGFWMSI